MNLRQVTGRGLSGRLLMVLAVVAVLAAPAHAAPFQLLKTFESELVGSATFEFTIEKQMFGVWIPIPCVDDKGSCILTFSNVAASTSFVLADSSDSWFVDGSFFFREVTPADWKLNAVEG